MKNFLKSKTFGRIMKWFSNYLCFITLAGISNKYFSEFEIYFYICSGLYFFGTVWSMLGEDLDE
jgi:hypothetical protein